MEMAVWLSYAYHTSFAHLPAGHRLVFPDTVHERATALWIILWTLFQELGLEATHPAGQQPPQAQAAPSSVAGPAGAPQPGGAAGPDVRGTPGQQPPQAQPGLGTEDGDETRIARDGRPYTRLEFIEHYKENWNACWEEASIATAGGAPQPAATHF